MKDINRILLVGRLGVAPARKEFKEVPAGVGEEGRPVRTWTRFSMATTRYYSVAGEEKPRSQTQWHQVVVYGQQAEHCVRYLDKGSTVLVDGSLRTREYRVGDGATGERRWTTEIIADQVNFLRQPRRLGSPGSDPTHGEGTGSPARDDESEEAALADAG